MNIADKIKKFDNTVPANVKQFEELFKIRLKESYKEDDLVEVLEPIGSGFRKILVDGKEEIIELCPVVDGRSKEDLYSGGRKFYRYVATSIKGSLLAEAYSMNELADKLKVSKETIINIMKRGSEQVENTGGRKRLDIIIKREELKNKKDRKLVTKNKKRFYFIVTKGGKEIGKFKGAKDAGKAIGVSETSIIHYSQGKTKNKEGYKVRKEEIK